jgi:tRNA threonylcarbamoyl adenosine modification protein (Sua5/YciO/YrdC/YwlC family)
MKIKKDTRVWIMPTDTVIGLHARAFDEEAIKRIYKIKGRSKSKKMINLVPSINSLKKFGIKANKRLKDFLKKVWPGPVSVIIDGQAFRVPNDKELLQFLKRVGPIVSTSANISGEETVKSMKQAEKIFGDKVDEYIKGRAKSKRPSLLVEIKRY